jgi:hypothetical protein
MQNGYCFAIALSLFRVSSSGGSTVKSSPCIFIDWGCRTILAVGNTVSGEEALLVLLAGTILGFIFLEVLKSDEWRSITLLVCKLFSTGKTD